MIFDSRGNPTVEVDMTTAKGTFRAAVPSGASTGIHEVRSHVLAGAGILFAQAAPLRARPLPATRLSWESQLQGKTRPGHAVASLLLPPPEPPGSKTNRCCVVRGPWPLTVLTLGPRAP